MDWLKKERILRVIDYAAERLKEPSTLLGLVVLIGVGAEGGFEGQLHIATFLAVAFGAIAMLIPDPASKEVKKLKEEAEKQKQQ